MKRNQTTKRVRHELKSGGKSLYAEKVKRGTQMYGPGCCAHRIRLNYWSGGNKDEG